MNAHVDMRTFREKVSTRYLKSKYRILAADTSDRSLNKKYEKFSRHEDIYNASVSAYQAIGRALTSSELATTPYGEKAFYTNPSITYLQEIVKPSNPLSLFIATEKNWVETRLKAGDLAFALDFANPEKIGAAEKIIKSYFPNFVMPTKFDRADLEGQGNLGRFALGSRIENTLSVEQISSLVPNFTPPGKEASGDPSKDQEKYRFRLPSKYKESGFGKIAYIEMSMQLDRATLADQDGYGVKFGAAGSLLAGKYKAIIPVTVNLVYRWPWEFAQYVTCASSQSDFIPFLFYQYTNWHRIAYAGKRTRGGGLSVKPPARISSLTNIIKQIDAETKAGRVVKPRLNEDNFAILGTGEPAELGDIVWIDRTTNQISEYMNQIRSSYNIQDKKIDLSKLKIKGTALFYDPYNEKSIYVREAGSDKSSSDVSGIQTLDLTGSIALDPITIAKKLNARLDSDKSLIKDFQTLCYKALSGDYEGFTVTKPLNKQNLIAYGFSDYDAGKGRDIVSEMFQTIVESPDLNVTWAHVGGDRKLIIKNYDKDVEEGTPEAARYLRMAQVRAFCRLLNDLCGDFLRQFDKITVAYSAKVHRWRFLFTLISKYAKNDAAYQDGYNAAIAKNTAKVFKPEDVLNVSGKINLPNLPGIQSIMPHQSETLQDLAEKPEFAFIELTTGGGKCVEYNTLIPTSLGLIKVGELYDLFSGKKKPLEPGFKDASFKILGLNNREDANATFKTKGKSVTLETSLGDELECLKEHRFHTLLEDGSIDFKHAEYLKTGDWLPKTKTRFIYSRAAPKYIYNNKSYKMNESMAIILGFLVSEGYISNKEVSFVNADEKSIDLFKNSWNSLFNTPLSERLREGTQYFRARLDEQICIRSLLPSNKSSEKEVPLIVRQSPKHIQKAFLQALFEGDGGIYLKDNNRWMVEYYTTSKQLSRQVKYMLENLGIFSVSRKSMKSATNGRNVKIPCYTLSILRNDFIKFEKEVGFISNKKIKLLNSATNHQCQISKIQNTNESVCGIENQFPVGKFLNNAVDRLSYILNDHTFVSTLGHNRTCSLQWFWKNSFNHNQYNNPDQRASKFAKLFKSNKEIITTYSIYMFKHALNKLPSNIKRAVFSDKEFNTNWKIVKNSLGYVWTKVVNKTYNKTIKPMYDLTINGSHAYIANGFMSHNTPMGLIDALNLLQTGEVKRPLVAVPSHLVKNWASEIHKFTKGEVNVFIITIQTVRRLMQVYRNNTNPAAKPDYQLIKKIILGCPPNTIFLTNFRFMSIDKEDIVYANSTITRFYSAEFLREMNFDLVTYDESHGLKTLNSNQTQSAAIVASVAKYKRLMSGTLINNTLFDLVGQSALGNPSALGNKRTFESRYGASYSGDEDEEFTGEWRPDAASLIIQDMRPHVKRIIHKRDRIAFMLPQAVENFHQVSFTSLQKEFYDAMVARSFEELKVKNPKLFAKMIDANEADDAAISSGLSTAFQEIERFNCAPDTFPEFLNLEGITEKDKVSPKVGKIVELLDQHFQGTLDNDGNYTEQPNQYKVIIFGNRRASSAHVFKWLPEKYKKIAVHYTAENKQASEIFERSPNIRIMVADGASITSGLNLQFAARMIRLETVWAPGDLEQAFARIWRPDFAAAIGEGRVKVFLDWLITSESLDVAKAGRIVSKLVEKQKYDRQEDPNFTHEIFVPSKAFDSLSVGTESMRDIITAVKTPQPIAKMLDTLPLIKMNHATLADLREMGQLKEYFANYALINDFEEQQFERARKEGLQKLIPVPDECRSTIKDSKKLSFQNRVPGMNPDPFDPNGYFGYKPISIIDSEIALNEILELDEDDENYVEVNPVTGGELVDTEFGIGTIAGILQNEVWVAIKGLGKVRVPKATAWLITNPIAIQGITATLKRASIVRTPPGISDKPTDVYDLGTYPTNPLDKTSGNAEIDPDSVIGAKKTLVRFKAPPKPVEEPKKTVVVVKPTPKPRFDKFDVDEDEDEDDSIEINAEIIDGQIALVCLASDKDSDMLVQDYGFIAVPKYFAVEVINTQALDKLLDLLSTKFTIRDDYIANFQVYKELLKSKRLNQADPTDFKDTVQFFKTQQNKMIKEGILRPYPIVWGDSLYLAIDFNKTPSVRKASQAIRSANIAGVKMIKATDTEGMVLRFFKTNKDAIETLEEISDNVTVPNAEETKAYLQGIKKRNAPTENKKVDIKTDTTSKPKIKVQLKAPAPKEKVVSQPAKTLVRFKRK